MAEENSLERVACIARNTINEIDRLVRRQSLVASSPNSNVSNSLHVLTQLSSVSVPRTVEPQRSALIGHLGRKVVLIIVGCKVKTLLGWQDLTAERKVLYDKVKAQFPH